MKRYGKRLGALMLALAMSLSLAAPALAADDQCFDWDAATQTLTYVGQEEGQSEAINLFDTAAFKAPGESTPYIYPNGHYTQTMTLENGFDGSEYIMIYLRAEEPDEADMDLLEQITVTLKKGDTLLLSGGADELYKKTATENVLLTRLNAAESETITWQFDVEDFDNTLADATASLGVVFVVEELGEPQLTVTATATAPENGSYYAFGSQVPYTVTVTNSGGIPLQDVQVADPFGSGETVFTVDALDIGQDVTSETLYHTVAKADVRALHEEDLEDEDVIFVKDIGYWTTTERTLTATAKTREGTVLEKEQITAPGSLAAPIYARFPGDVNYDGKITTADAQLTLQMSVRIAKEVLETDTKGPVDVYNSIVREGSDWTEPGADGVVRPGTADAQLILQKAVRRSVKLY